MTNQEPSSEYEMRLVAWVKWKFDSDAVPGSVEVTTDAAAYPSAAWFNVVADWTETGGRRRSVQLSEDDWAYDIGAFLREVLEVPRD